MLLRVTMAVCSEIHIKHINTLCGQKVKFFNVKPRVTYRNHWASNVKENHKCIFFNILWVENRA